MARTNYSFEKRQREKARQQKQKEKELRRAEAKLAKSQPALTEDTKPAEPETVEE